MERLEQLLIESDFDEQKRQFLVQGFSNGFELGYQGPSNRTDTSDNIPLHIGTKTHLWNKVMKEVKWGRFTGPFDDIPYDSYIQSPIGLVPKDDGK